MPGVLKEVFKKRGHHHNAQIDFWYFPSIGEYATELEKQNFRVLNAEHFDRNTPLNGKDGIRNWFLMFGDNLFINIPPEEKDIILNEVQDKTCNNSFCKRSLECRLQKDQDCSRKK